MGERGGEGKGKGEGGWGGGAGGEGGAANRLLWVTKPAPHQDLNQPHCSPPHSHPGTRDRRLAESSEDRGASAETFAADAEAETAMSQLAVKNICTPRRSAPADALAGGASAVEVAPDRPMTGAPNKQERLGDQWLFGSSSFASQSAARSAPQTEVPSCSQQHQRAVQQHGKSRSRAPDSGHTGSLVRLDINRSPLTTEPMGRSFLFREARFFEQDYADEATPWSPTRRRNP